MNPRYVAEALAQAAIAGEATAPEIARRFEHVLGRRHGWIAALSRRVFARFGSQLADGMQAQVGAFIVGDEAFRDAWIRKRLPRVFRHPLEAPRMQPRKGALAACRLPELATPGDIARWLGLSVGELDWFTDFRRINDAKGGALDHYHYRWIRKRQGWRLIEIPKFRLREIQRRILREILDAVPAHAAAHGFVRGRSPVTHARLHSGQRIVLHLDLRHFFTSVAMPRVAGLFRSLGYPEASARVLAALCTHGSPRWVLGSREGAELPMRERAALERRHLPQGAPTSPALANLCALHLDFRLQGLAAAMGCGYSRYADDIAISGGAPLSRSVPRTVELVSRIAIEEGFEVNHRKTRAMHAGTRQMLTGVVVNVRTNARRSEFDALKAILHNCATLGPASQDRGEYRDFRRHLEGRVAHMRSLNGAKAEKLAAILGRIDWDGG